MFVQSKHHRLLEVYAYLKKVDILIINNLKPLILPLRCRDLFGGYLYFKRDFCNMVKPSSAMLAALALACVRSVP